MSRLIDADDLKDLMFVAFMSYERGFINMLENIINDCPTIDAIEVVRCKDCKYGAQGYIQNKDNSTTLLDEYLCIKHNKIVEPDDFCSYGERRESDDARVK